MQNIAILRNDKEFLAVQINPQAYKCNAFTGKPNPNSILSLNINYSWGIMPIGYVRNNNTNWITLPNKAKRPCLCLTKEGFASVRNPSHPDFDITKWPLVMQGGPTLVSNKKNVATASIKTEGFRADAVRRTDHIAIGTTKVGKIVIVFGHNASMTELADELIVYKSINGFKCDGGSKLFLQLKTSIGLISLGEATSCKAGLQFEPQ